MSIEDLYRDVILDHNRNPRNRGTLESPDAHAEGNNPLCGDELTLDLRLDGDQIVEVAILGQGCSISQSSASMMSQAIKGKTLAEVRTIIATFKAMMDIEAAPSSAGIDPDHPGAVLGDLEALQGVRKFPVRIKCANLAWTTLEEALSSHQSRHTVLNTED